MNLQLDGVNGQLTITEEHAIIERKGVLGFMTQGLKGQKRIPLQNIKAVQLKEGNNWTNGYIQFSILGGIESRGGIMNATKDENTLMFRKKDNELAKEIRAFVEEKISEYINNNNSTIINQLSVADEILKYKNLLDSDIITQDEFDAKKKQLLEL